VLPSDAAAEPAIAAYREAYSLIPLDAAAAETAFGRLHADAPSDPCVAFHLERLKRGEHSPRFVMTEK
jgi:hypothetical protein